MEFTQHHCLSSKQCNKSKISKPSSTGLWQSIVIHALVLVVLLQTSLSNNHLTSMTVKENPTFTQPLIQPIRANFFYAKQVVHSSKANEEQTILDTQNTPTSVALTTNKKESIQPHNNTFTVSDPLKNIITKGKLVKQQANNDQNHLNNKPPRETNQRFNALSSLEKLSRQQDLHAMNTSMSDHYQQREKEKKSSNNQSINVYGHIPEAKAKKLEVNCHNTVLKGLSILGGLMGGSIKCNSYNGADKYIKARLKTIRRK